MILDGARVLDLALFLPGQHLSQLMADQGAELIEFDPPAASAAPRPILLTSARTPT